MIQGVRFPVILAGIVLLLIPVAGPVRGQTGYDEEIRQHQEQLELLRKEAETKRKEAQRMARQEKDVAQRLAQAEEALAAARKYIQKLEERQGAVQDQIRKTMVDLSWAQDELTTRRAELSRRLRFSYMNSRARILEVVFSAQSFPTLLQRTAFLNRVLQQDRRLIEAVAERETEVQKKLERLEQQRTEVERLRVEKEHEEMQYQDLKDERERDLHRIRNEKSAHERAAKELDRSAKHLETLMAELERKRREAERRNDPVLAELDAFDFSKNKGKLPWPVGGDVITGFGRQEHPKYKTVTISNGIDIASAPGTPVRSVGDGVVDLVKWLPGYGETVIVNHGRGFYSIYGHLATVSVSPDDRVKPAQILGTVGDTGSLKGPCLHLEIREKGTALDPTAWLR